MPALRASGSASTYREPPRLRASVIGTLPPIKGISPYTLSLVQALAASGDVEVDVHTFRSIYPRRIFPGGDPEEQGATAPVLDGVRVRRGLTWYNPLSWISTGLRLRGDVVHAQWWSHVLAPVYITVLGIARLRGKRTVITVHNIAPHEDGRLKRAVNHLVLRLGDAYIVHSEHNRVVLARMLGCAPERISVLPHGVLETPRAGIGRAAARMRLGLPRAGGVLLCFGNIRPYKGVDVLLRAFASVVRAEPGTTLVIAGKLWTDWAPYGALIDELDIAGDVRLALDYIPSDELEPYFTAADAVVLPYTHFEAQSGAGTRALPFGRPLIVTDTGGLPELVLDPEAVVPPGDAAALARAIVRVLRDDAVRDRMSVDSLALAASLSWDGIAARTVALYAMLTGTRAPVSAEDRDEQTAAPVAGVRRT